MAVVVVSRYLPVDASAGDVWKETYRAELRRARDFAERIAHYREDFRCVRIQAQSNLSAIVAGATGYSADTILLAERVNLRGRLATFFGTTAAIVRRAPCG